MTNIEEMKKEAINQYAVDEMNNIIDMFNQTDNPEPISTSMTKNHSLLLTKLGDGITILVIRGYVEMSIKNPHASIYGGCVGITDYENSGGRAIFPAVVMLQWLEELKN